MARKRKAVPKEEPKPEPEPVGRSEDSEEEDEEEEEVEEEEEEVEEEEEEEEKVESSDNEEEAESEEEDEEDEPSKRETLKQLLEPFGKDQLINILKEAANTNPNIISTITNLADSDPVHRKIFVHGLGWDTTNETLTQAFKQYGQIEECKVVSDKLTGRSKGYAFILFKTRAGARKALKQPQKKIGNRMTACQLASTGPVQSSPAIDVGSRKLYIANVGPQVSPESLQSFFSKFGEIEEGPSGFDRVTGKFKGYAIIIYKTVDGLKKALEEPIKLFQGCKLHCQKAGDGVRTPKLTNLPQPAVVASNNVVVPSLPTGFSQGFMGQNLNPLGVFVGQNPALGIMNPMLGMNQVGLSPSFVGGVSQTANRGGTTAHMGLNAGFAPQQSINSISPSVIGSYGAQAALQGLGAYQSNQLVQPSVQATGAARTQPAAGSLASLSTYFSR